MSWKDLIEDNEKIDTVLLSKFLNTATTGTAQGQYYVESGDELAEIKHIHAEMLESQREVYALCMMLPINDFHKHGIIINLLTKPKSIPKEQRLYENRIILSTLKRMPTNRAYKVFTILQKNKVNNTRSRWIAKRFVLSKVFKLPFEAVKYKRWLKNLIKHNHLKPSGDEQERVFEFLFNKMKKSVTYPEIIQNYVKAKTDPAAVFKLPHSVALGFKSLHKIKDDEFMQKIKGTLTHQEKIRVQNVAERTGVKVATNLASYSPVQLLKYLRASEKRHPDAFNTFMSGCQNISQGIPLHFKSIWVVVDRSASMYGVKQKKYHPIAVAEACGGVLAHLADNGDDLKSMLKEKFLAPPSGDTDLATPVLAALEQNPELLVIVSDGYENKPAGLVNQIINAYLTKLHGKTGIIHLNPVFAPESHDIRKLNDKIVTMGIRDVSQLFLVLLIALANLKKTKEIQKIMKNLKKKVAAV